MTKGLIFFDEFAVRCVHVGDTKMYTSGSVANLQRMLTEINESRIITKVRI